MSRFAIRPATLADADGIASTHTLSWQTSYRGILPDHILDRIDVGQRAATRRRILANPAVQTLVAYDATHGDIVGFCDAGPRRGAAPAAGEIYAFYIEHHAKRHGLGRELFERTALWLVERAMPSLVIWVLDNNPGARRFYEAMGGQAGGTLNTTIAGFPVVERAYLWARL